MHRAKSSSAPRVEITLAAQFMHSESPSNDIKINFRIRNIGKLNFNLSAKEGDLDLSASHPLGPDHASIDIHTSVNLLKRAKFFQENQYCTQKIP